MQKNQKTSMAEIKKQMEYYMGDTNLERDDFFREKITSNKSGYVSISLFMNCNNVKKMGITTS